MWEHEALGEFFPGSLPWLHLLLTSAEHQHNLCFHTSMVGIETGLINSKGGRDEKPFPHHFGDLPWLNWRCFLSHALFFCNVFSSKFFLKAKNAMPSMFRSVLPIFFFAVVLSLVMSPHICMCWFWLHFLVTSILLTLGRILSPNSSQGWFLY